MVVPSATKTAAPAPPDLDSIPLVTVLEALADPVRLEIVKQLAGCPGTGELACKDVELPVTKSTASHHLKTLTRAGVTAEREQGVYKFIRLRRAELDRRFPGLLDSILGATEPR